MTPAESAAHEMPHTRAWRIGMEKHGSTPIFDHLTAKYADLADTPAPAAKKSNRKAGGE